METRSNTTFLFHAHEVPIRICLCHSLLVTSASDFLHYVQYLQLLSIGRSASYSAITLYCIYNQLLTNQLRFCLCGQHPMVAHRGLTFTDIDYS